MRSIKIRCGHGVEEVYGDLATPWKDRNGRQIYEGDTVMSENGTIPSKVVFNGFQFLLEKDLDWLFFTPFIPKRDASNDSLLEGYEIVDPVEEHDAGGTVKSKENEND